MTNHNQTMTPGIKRERLRIELELALGKPVPDPTLYRWLRQTAIGPKKRYSPRDFETLVIFAQALQEDRNLSMALAALKEYLQQRRDTTHDNDQTRIKSDSWQYSTIQVECSA